MLHVLDVTAEGVVGIALAGELAAVFANVVGRAVFAHPFLWTNEIASLSLSVLAFIGGVVAYRQGGHAAVQTLLHPLSPFWRHVAECAAEAVILIIAVVAALASVPLVAARWADRTPILGIPEGLDVMPLTVGMVLLALYALLRLAAREGRAAAGTTLVLMALTGLGIAFQPTLNDWFAGDAAMIATLAVCGVTILGGLAVGFALLLAAALYLFLANPAPMIALPQNMVDGTGNFVLLAIPFFVLAGLIMERGGISLRLVHFVNALVGHLRGGLLQVLVVSMYLISGLSGSKTADVAAVGSVMRDMLRRSGCPEGEGTAVLAASAAMGECVPPSIAMLVLGSITTISIGAMFVGGLLPAAVIALCLMALIFIRARKLGMQKGEWVGIRAFSHSTLHAILPLLMPVILFAGILLGVATPTEVSSFAVVYGLVLSMAVYRELDWRSLRRVVVQSAVLSGMVLFILAAASSFAWTLTVALLPQRLVALLEGAHASVPVFMIGSVVLLVVIGSVLEGLPALIILAPLLLPISGQLGISELHYGIVLLIAMGIGAFLPPAGVGFYITCAILESDTERSARAMLPYLGVLIAGLLLVAFVPWITVFLPRAVGFAG
jgi:tripartite ATP-independent transporter DctM subunit